MPRRWLTFDDLVARGMCQNGWRPFRIVPADAENCCAKHVRSRRVSATGSTAYASDYVYLAEDVDRWESHDAFVRLGGQP